MATTDKDGNIAEPCSKNYGKKPDPDTQREKMLLRFGWLYLLIPIAGIVPYSQIRAELTNRWGHPPWWL